jgi:hypothetical protein
MDDCVKIWGKIMRGGNLRRAHELYSLDSFIDLSANINLLWDPFFVCLSAKWFKTRVLFLNFMD